MRYLRVCKRCKKAFYSASKRGKICNECSLVKKYKTRYNHEKIRKENKTYYLVPSTTHKKMVAEIEEYRLIKYKKESDE